MMDHIRDYSSRVEIVSVHPLVATLTFETESLKSVIRVTYDTEFGKYWIQLKSGLRCLHSSVCADVSNLDDRGIETLASALFENIRHDFADGLGSHGITVDAVRDHFVVYADNESEIMSEKDLRDFALHTVNEFDTNYLPSFEEVLREIAAGLRQIADLAGRDKA